ncbi:hypothetical protein NDU88_006550 [Pleurodeles waltl]|uniref:Uncharacterized protein n=1 Tax=Pleurodeles waltl TaxID=8319 RepID=A0AAV7PLD3_PLEWA|nr:hypothetical protein NDU88_006550 [Pleurodeles waltl]
MRTEPPEGPVLDLSHLGLHTLSRDLLGPAERYFIYSPQPRSRRSPQPANTCARPVPGAAAPPAGDLKKAVCR